FKRVKNITKDVEGDNTLDWSPVVVQGNAPKEALAEKALIDAVNARDQVIQSHTNNSDYYEALTRIAELRPTLDQYFVDVMVMSDNPQLRKTRQGVLAHVRDLVLGVADISEIAVDPAQSG